MVDTKALKGLIVSKGFTQKEIYSKLNLTPRQWYARLSEQKFDSDEMYTLKNILGDETIPIFFSQKVTY